MDKRGFSFNIGQERLDKIKTHIYNPDTVTNFITRAIDHELVNLETKHLSDFIYYIGFPTLAFLGMVAVTLILPSLFFYILTSVVGVYIIILFYLFYNKYRKVKQHASYNK